MGEGFTQKGPNEVRMIVDKLEPMVRGKDVVDGVKQIFDKGPCMCWDNYFSGDVIFDYVGRKGMGMISTVRRDRLP